MVKIRMKRLGRKKRPFYRIIAIDTHAKRQGAALAQLGFYNPFSRELRLNKVEVQGWLDKGAQATPTVLRLLKFAPESGELVVVEKPQKEVLSKKAQARLKAEADAKAKEAEAKAEAAVAPPVEQEPVAASVEESAVPEQEPAAEA